MRRLVACLAALLLGACGAEPGGRIVQGYIEGEFVEVASESAGRVVEVSVQRGSEVQQGAALFRLDDTEESAAVAQARAQLARSEAELRNVNEGQRPPEIAVIEARLSEATASLDTARKDLERQRSLFERRVASEARLDQAQQAVSVAEARVAAVQRERDVAALPARTPVIEASERGVEAARAALAQAEARLTRRVVTAPVAGRIEDVHYEEGEVASAGSSVLSLLPTGRRKVVFFVPEPLRAEVRVGADVQVTCDGCPASLTARVDFLSAEAEFTPPVIFSRDSRDKLVFRVEAALGPQGEAVPLGQPVDVALPAAEGR